MISRTTQIALRNLLVCFPLREIKDLFDSTDIRHDPDLEPKVQGQRRQLVEQYYACVDFNDRIDIERILRVCTAVVLDGRCSTAELLQLLKQDGYDWAGSHFVPATAPLFMDYILAFARPRNLHELERHVDRLIKAVDTDPPLAVGVAKDMLESVCKTILEDMDVVAKNETLPKLVQMVGDKLAVLPNNVPNEVEGADVVRRVLGNLAQISVGIARLRNLYGIGHGGQGSIIAHVTPRHARLAVRAAAALATFLLETHRDVPSATQQPVGGAEDVTDTSGS